MKPSISTGSFCFFYKSNFLIKFLFFTMLAGPLLAFAFRGQSGYLTTGNGNNAPSILHISSPPAVCNLSADETIKVCARSVDLNVDPGEENFTWNTGAKTSSITVSESGNYWWEVVSLARNTVTNSFFSSGNAGVSSSYTYVAPTASTGPFGAVTQDGTYTVTTSPSIGQSLFKTFGDHTSGSGGMMVVNGASKPEVMIWNQNITVEPNTSYVFSIWGASATAGNPGKLAFSINGKQIGNIQLSSATGYWQNFTVYWTSNTDTQAAIAIVNKNTASNGNDFALDDIVFAPVCRKNFAVTLDPKPSKPVTTYTRQ